MHQQRNLKNNHLTQPHIGTIDHIYLHAVQRGILHDRAPLTWMFIDLQAIIAQGKTSCLYVDILFLHGTQTFFAPVPCDLISMPCVAVEYDMCWVKAQAVAQNLFGRDGHRGAPDSTSAGDVPKVPDSLLSVNYFLG